MRIAAFVMLLCVLPGAALAHDSPQLTQQLLESRNAAAGFAGTLKFAVGRAARTCRDVLGKDDAYMTAIVNDWLSRNGDYSGAAEKWTSFVVSSIANQQGLAKGLAARDEIFATVKVDAQKEVDSLLGTTDADKAKACLNFPAEIHAGKLDITPSAKLYPELHELVTNFASDAP
jgi:hypothetical protein